MILFWCLAPAYWMVVTAFRDVGYTYDTSILPTHVTLDNFKTAFDTSFGNHFGQALLNSLFIGTVVTWSSPGDRRVRRLRPGPA